MVLPIQLRFMVFPTWLHAQVVRKRCVLRVHCHHHRGCARLVLFRTEISVMHQLRIFSFEIVVWVFGRYRPSPSEFPDLPCSWIRFASIACNTHSEGALVGFAKKVVLMHISTWYMYIDPWHARLRIVSMPHLWSFSGLEKPFSPQCGFYSIGETKGLSHYAVLLRTSVHIFDASVSAE